MGRQLRRYARFDVIMTPFEYDENPWDGWGVWTTIGAAKIRRRV